MKVPSVAKDSRKLAQEGLKVWIVPGSELTEPQDLLIGSIMMN